MYRSTPPTLAEFEQREQWKQQQRKLNEAAEAEITRIRTNHDSMKPTLGLRSDGPGLIYPGRIHSIAGESESGKTWIALHIAKGFIDQAPMYSDATLEQIPFDKVGPTVGYWDYDDDRESIEERASLLGIDPDPERLSYIGSPDQEDIELELADDLLITDDLIIIDNVSAAMETLGLRGTSNDDVSKWFAMVPKRLTSKGKTVILLDHLTKANDGTGRYALGGVQKLAALSGAQYIVDVRKPFGVGMVGEVELRVTKDRQGRVRAIGTDYRQHDRSARVALFTLDAEVPEEIETRLDPPEAKKHVSEATKTNADEKTYEYIAANPGCSLRDLLKDVNGDQPSLRKTIARLTDAERVKKVPEGRKHAHYACN